MERWTVENPAALFWDESDVCRSSRLNYAMPPVKRPARGNREYGKNVEYVLYLEGEDLVHIFY